MQDVVLDARHVYKVKKSSGFGYAVWRMILLVLLLSVCFCLDFVWYLRSGTVWLFDNGMNIPILGIMAGIVLAIFVLLLVTSFSKDLRAVVFGLCGGVLVWGCLRQFALVDGDVLSSEIWGKLLDDNFLGVIQKYFSLIVSVIAFFVFYWVAKFFSNKSLIMLILVGGVFIAGAFAADFWQIGNHGSWRSVYHEKYIANFNNKQKTVFLFVPNLTSYANIKNAQNNNRDLTDLVKNVELGFFEKYGFNVYPNAYALAEDSNKGLLDILNIRDNSQLEKTVSENHLLDVYNRAGYKTYGYHSERDELCKQNGQYAINECTTQNMGPVNFGGDSVNQALLLLTQWGASFDILNNKEILSGLQYIVSDNLIAEMSFPYTKLYTINSFDVLQRLLDDISANNQAGVYWVYLDSPSDVLVYDEFCEIKEPDAWKSLNYSLKLKDTLDSTKDYNQQILCMYGILEELLNSMKSTGIWNDTTFIIQGTNARNYGLYEDVNLANKFKENYNVMFAIHQPYSEFKIYNDFCYGKEILLNRVFDAEQCKEFNYIKFDGNAEGKIRKIFTVNDLTVAEKREVSKQYSKWLEQWNEKNPNKKIQIRELLIGDEELVGNQLYDINKMIEAIKNNNKVTEKRDETDNKPEKVEALSEENNIIPTEDVIPLENVEVSNVVDVSKDINIEMEQKEDNVEEKDSSKVDEMETKSIKKLENKDLEIKEKNETIKSQLEQTNDEKEQKKQHEVKEDKKEDEKEKVSQNIENKTETVDKIEIYQGDEQVSSMSADFLLEEIENDWELDPAKALGVSGESDRVEKIIVKVK